LIAQNFPIFFSIVFRKNEIAKSFHDILAPVIVLGNIFSIFPVSGIFSKDAKDVKFRFLYPVTMFSAVVQLCFLIELVLLFIFLSKTGIKFFMVGELNAIQEAMID
jgi:Trehalose receptor